MRHAAAPSAAPAATQREVPAWVDPLRNLQLIFGFYDRRFSAYNGGADHLGLDLAASAGAPVFAICDGSVALNRTDRAEVVAAVLVVEHDCPQPLGRVYAYYGHIQSELAQGDGVRAGDAVGAVRNWPGNGHLHIGLSRQLTEDNWGFIPRGSSLQEIEAQGWLNPLDYFTPTSVNPGMNGLKRVAPQPTVHRQNRARNIPRQRRR